MAFRKTLAQRLFSISRMTNPASTNCGASSAYTVVRSAASDKLAPDPGECGMCRRYIHRRSEAMPSALRFLPTGEKLLEKIRGMDVMRDRIRLDGLRPPTTAEESPEGNLTVADAKKILRLSQMEMVKSTLRQLQKDCISYSKFLEICAKDCSTADQGLEFAKTLDESGSVIVLGNIVFLRPEKVVKAIRGLILVQTARIPNDTMMKELHEMEKQKSAIDKKAESCVRRELWLGLGCLVAQTAAFMRLTFWELSWDVMEPICFYVTSMYFMGGYAFFLRTSKEPSFEGFFQSRFGTKQKKLMRAKKFDIERYNELKKACYPQEGSSNGVYIDAQRM